jgi:hypothetical protein
VAQMAALQSKASEDERMFAAQIAALQSKASEDEQAFVAQIAALQSKASEDERAFLAQIARLQSSVQAVTQERDVARMESKVLRLRQTELEQANAEQQAQLYRHVQSLTQEAEAIRVELHDKELHWSGREQVLLGRVQATEFELRAVQDQLSANRQEAQEAALRFADRERELVLRTESLRQRGEAEAAEALRRFGDIEQQFKEDLMERERSYSAHVARLVSAFQDEAANNDRDLDYITRLTETANENIRQWQLHLSDGLFHESSQLRAALAPGLKSAYEARGTVSSSMLPAHPGDAASTRGLGTITDVDHLMALHDEAFVDAAYHFLLGRAPDPDGRAFYLAQIRSGHPKDWMLAKLRLSREGQERAVDLPGLELAISREVKAHRSKALWLSRKLGAGRSLEEHERKLRAVENQIGCLVDKSAASLEEMGRAIRALRPELDATRQVLRSIREAWPERQRQLVEANTPPPILADRTNFSASREVEPSSNDQPVMSLGPEEAVALTRLSGRARRFYLRVGRIPKSGLKGVLCVS